MSLPVAVGQNQTLLLSTGFLTLPAPQPLLARPAPPLARRLLLIIVVPCQPEGVKWHKDVYFFSPVNFWPFIFSYLPQFGLKVRNFKVNNSSNWTVIATGGGFVWIFYSLSWPVSYATTNTCYHGCSFHELIKTLSGDLAWLTIKEFILVYLVLPTVKQPLTLKVYISL